MSCICHSTTKSYCFYLLAKQDFVSITVIIHPPPTTPGRGTPNKKTNDIINAHLCLGRGWWSMFIYSVCVCSVFYIISYPAIAITHSPTNTLPPPRPPFTELPGTPGCPGKNVKKSFFLTISHTPCQHTLHHTLTTLPSLCIRNQPPFTLRKTEKMRIFLISLFSEFFLGN